MNYLELCEVVYEELDNRPVPFTALDLGRNSEGEYFVEDHTQRQVIRAVARVYQEICQASDFWKFHRTSGLFLSALPGIETYEVFDVDRVNWDSVYLLLNGVKYPLRELRYDLLLDRKRHNVTQTGVPSELSRGHGDTWHLWPVPRDACEVWAEWWTPTEGFSGPSDTSAFSEKYDNLIIWQAIRDLSFDFYGETQKAGQIRKKADRIIRPLWDSFLKEYEPKMVSP